MKLFGGKKLKKLVPSPASPPTEVDTAEEMAAARREFQKLRDRCPEDQMVCGTIRPNGRPVYFLAARDLPDGALEDRAFAARNGRDRLPGERILGQMAAKHAGRGE